VKIPPQFVLRILEKELLRAIESAVGKTFSFSPTRALEAALGSNSAGRTKIVKKAIEEQLAECILAKVIKRKAAYKYIFDKDCVLSKLPLEMPELPKRTKYARLKIDFGQGNSTSCAISIDLLKKLDELVKRGVFPSRSAAIREAIKMLLKEYGF